MSSRFSLACLVVWMIVGAVACGDEVLASGGDAGRDLGTAPSDLGPPRDLGPPQDLGGDPRDLGGDPIDLGGDPIDLGGDPVDLGGDPIDLGGDPIDLGPPGCPASCNDGDVCTADSCSSAGSCVHTLIDADGDGFAPSSSPDSCGDCNDTNASAVPGQMTYSSTPHTGGFTTPSFDWNCNTVIEQRWTAIGGPCVASSTGCSGEGWIPRPGVGVPACGIVALYRTCVPSSGGTVVCAATDVDQRQACR